MNKKFSTLVASFLLAGAWMTMDAAVRTVTPVAGGTYAIGTAVDEEAGTITGAWSGFVMSAAEATLTSSGVRFELETVAGTTDQFYVKCNGAYVEYSSSATGYLVWANVGEGYRVKFKLKDGGLVVAAANMNTGGFAAGNPLLVDEVTKAVTINYNSTTAKPTKLTFAVWNDDVTVLTQDVALQTSFANDEYYLIAADASHLLKDNGTGTLSTTTAPTIEVDLDNFLWKISTGKAADGKTTTYTFTNKKSGKKAVVGNIDAFLVNGSAASFQLSLNAENGQTLGDGFTVNATAANFGVYKSPVLKAKASALNDLLNEGFNMTIKQGASDKSVIKGVAPFGGKLKATVSPDGTRFQLMDDDKYVVLNKKATWGEANIGANDRGAKFELVSATELNGANKANYLSWFEFNYYAGNTKSEIKTVDVFADNVAATNAFGSLFIQTLNGQICLTTSNALVDATVEAWPYIVLAADNIVDPADILADKFFKFTKLATEDEEEAIYAVKGCGATEHGLVKSVGNDLEAQWAVTYDETTEKYTLKNRENPTITFDVNKGLLREDDNTKDNIYVVDGELYKIEAITPDASSDYYKYLGDVENQRFRMAHYSAIYDGKAWFTTDDEGFVIINTDEDKAIEIAAANDKVAKKDTAEVKSTVNYYVNGEKKSKDYILKVPVYTFATKAGKLGLSGDKYQFDADADIFAIRKDGAYWNLRPVTVTANVATMECEKLYASTSDNGYLKKANGLYTETTNDLFDIVEKNRPVYRRLGVTVTDEFTGKVDTAKFFRTNEVSDYYLYENTGNRNTQGGKPSLNFLGESHLNDLPETAALPFLIDTAYVRNNTTKPLYLLAVRDAEWVEGTPFKPCDKEDNHGYDENGNALTAEQCPHATPAVPGYRKADYLVALTDSIGTDHDMIEYKNKTRLAFVPATHFENDTLVIESSKFTNKKKEAYKDSLSFVNKAGEQQMNAATFAFRLVNPQDVDNDGAGDFYIETEVNGETQYVHVLNSVPVLVSNIEDAAPFNIESAKGEAATSNDEITAEGVTVVTTDGAVIVKGAEGKKVVITNVLGQTIANTVVTSSEATIAAPKGYVTVAVEGEAAVKAIVK